MIGLSDNINFPEYNFTLIVTNTAPTFIFSHPNTTLTDQTVSINKNIYYTLPNTTDQENNSVCFNVYYETYGKPLPNAIKFDNLTGVFSIKSTNFSDVGYHTVYVDVSDTNLWTTYTFSILFQNLPPEFNGDGPVS